MPVSAYINRIATAVPEHEVHEFYLRYAASMLPADRRKIFQRMAGLAGIEHRFSCFAPALDPEGSSADLAGTFRRGAFPGTAARMAMFSQAAPVLAQKAVNGLHLGDEASRITHLIITTCTGFSAPGIDLDLAARCGLPDGIERTMIGFMGCYAAINGLKLARHIVRSDPRARVLMVNIEVCTLHLRETTKLEKLLSFCLWGDGCAATLVTAEPPGIELDSFRCTVACEQRALMTWDIRDHGFDMVLSGQVPAAVQQALRSNRDAILGGRPPEAIDLWAVHPGGRTILDAVERALDLEPSALEPSREVLRQYGNMSSPTVMFVMEKMLQAPGGRLGCGMSFGPGLTAETMLFRTVS
ncbi:MULTISPECIES: type III polyketide synthase [unclassified Mesorhizobium]|uniref:type III polyketide synthase n=1 Tax=unclassified Mesorhizobium TaxID=325217 RepID=UPI000BAF1F0F|nr:MULTISPECIES: type III polyketide synthase [unclassified Mesorhizobium]TGT61091.1 type III polyketide synthase [Mesorhizobium sp. M00.F.Ca.ET.170.01.1.1]AZO08861.1 type III polyketide synthase [Mesorhizobium sp. M3A.F.Ca.ET.080.04.2.1]PBB84276.1 type III polyketide synthase [Mesorhizobium sp. WSM3876]RWB67457.1 MAG: type III polyketide synthase [Mesorhizobium sp.]RWB84671.1 MAG: type III polyketide synthase [Mesorhizobium sp.]